MLSPTERTFQHILEEEIPFCRFLGLKLIKITNENITIKLPFMPQLIGDVRRPAIHGGVIAALLDTVGGAVAIWSLASPEEKISTVDLRVDYLLPGESKDIYAEGSISRRGNRIIVTRMIAYQESRRNVIAEGKGVYNLSRRDDESAT